MKNKFLSFLCALLAIVTLLSACGKKDENPAESTPADTTSIVTEDVLLALVENKEIKVNVVYPENATGGERNAAESIYNLLRNSYGSAPSLNQDFMTHDAEAVEILIGNTNYTESREALAAMKYSEWAVKVVGNKILVCAHLDEGVKKACETFRDYLVSKKTPDSLYVEKTLAYSGKVESLSYFDSVPSMGAGLSSVIYDTGDGCRMIQYKKVSADVYAGYDALVTAAGYQKISSYDFLTDKNKYAHYVNGDTILNVFYSTYDKTARVFVENTDMTSVVPATAGQYTTVSGYVPKMLQVGITDPVGTGDTTYNGECYMFYLADGSFVVFDGGLDDTVSSSSRYKRQNARRIYEIVKSYTPAGKTPTIAAWIITHGHNDHMGAFMAFDELNYNDRVTVESVILNLPSHEMYDDLSDANGYDTDLPKYKAGLRNYAANGTKVYKAHPGQIFHVRNVDLQILFSPEQRADEDMDNFNSSSVVTRVVVKDANGQEVDTVMITGDMYGVVGTELANLYGEAMHCNLVQMPHHGYYKFDTGVFWQKVKANYILWPIAKEKASQEDWHGDVAVWTEDYTPWLKKNLLNNDMNSDKIFWAYYDTIVFDLPFTGKNFTRTPNTVYS